MPTPGETQLVSEAKGYDGGTAAEAKRQMDSYYENFGDRDTEANWGIVLRMAEPRLQPEMERLRAQARGTLIDMDLPMEARGSSRDAGNAETGKTVVRERGLLEGTGADPMVKEKLGIVEDPGTVALGARSGALDATHQAVQGNVAGRGGMAPIPETAPTKNVSMEQPPQGPGYAVLPAGVAPLHSSQSSNQGVIEPEEAKQLRAESYADDRQALEEQTFASHFASQQRLKLENERIGKLNQMAKDDAAFQDRQNRIAEESEGRIRSAEQALKESEIDPDYNPMRQIMEGDDWGKKIMMGMGVLFGSIGEGTGGGPNKFFEQYHLAVNRKIDLMEKRYRARKDYLGAAQDGYARMRQILQDQQATRAMIEARAWQMFDAEVDKVGQQYGLDASNAQYLALRSEIANKHRTKAMEAARTTNHTVGMQEQFRPQQVIPLGGDSNLGPDIKAIVQAREVKKLPIIEGAMDNVATALGSMAKDHSSRDGIAQWLRTGNGLASGLAPYIAENKDAFTRIQAAANDYVVSKAGSAQTEGEVQRLAPVIGRGGMNGIEATRRFYAILRNEHRAKQADIQAMEGYAEFERRKGAYSDAPSTQTYEPRVDPIGAPAVK